MLPFAIKKYADRLRDKQKDRETKRAEQSQVAQLVHYIKKILPKLNKCGKIISACVANITLVILKFRYLHNIQCITNNIVGVQSMLCWLNAQPKIFGYSACQEKGEQNYITEVVCLI
jgi:hypothetical protein